MRGEDYYYVISWNLICYCLVNLFLVLIGGKGIGDEVDFSGIKYDVQKYSKFLK